MPLLGRKVSVRFRLHDDPDHPVSEAIGVVMSVEGTGVQRVAILKRNGDRVELSSADVVAAKSFS